VVVWVSRLYGCAGTNFMIFRRLTFNLIIYPEVNVMFVELLNEMNVLLTRKTVFHAGIFRLKIESS
jgi:hypothetical protein